MFGWHLRIASAVAAVVAVATAAAVGHDAPAEVPDADHRSPPGSS